MFICQNLSCRRDHKLLIEGLGFCLPEGGFLLIDGTNGSGKSTLLQTFAGLRPPHAGQLLWHDKPVINNRSFKEELTYIGHHNALMEHATVKQNIGYWAALHQTQTMADVALHYYGLEAYANTLCSNLSAGWQRRVALARLLLSTGKIWLLDEPTNFLDEEGILLTGSLLETRVQRGGIVIAISHSIKSSFPTHVMHIEDFSPTGKV